MRFARYLLLAVLTASIVTGVAPAAQTARVQSADVEFTFEGAHQEKLLIDAIKLAKTTLDIATYSLSDPQIMAATKDAKKRGVAVRIIYVY